MLNEATIWRRLEAARKRRLPRKGIPLSAATTATVGEAWAAVPTFLAVAVIAGSTTLFAQQGIATGRAEQLPQAPAAARTRPAQQDGEKTTRTDLYGDPLPPGALMRMGTDRFTDGLLGFSADGKALFTDGGFDGKRMRPVLRSRVLPGGKLRQERVLPLGTPLPFLPLDQFEFVAGGKAAVNISDKTIQVWEVASGKELSRVPASQEGACEVALSADMHVLAATVGQLERIHLWDLRTGNKRVLPGHNKGVYDLALSADGRHLAYTGEDKHIHLWDLGTNRQLCKVPIKTERCGCHFIDNRKVVFSPGGETLAWVTDDREAVLFSVADRKEVGRIRIEAPEETENASLTFAPDGKILAAHGYGGIVLYDAATRKKLRRIPTRAFIEKVAFSADGRTLAATDGTIQLWDVVTGQRHPQPDRHRNRVIALAFSPDGKKLASLDADHAAIRLWDAPSGKLLRTLGMGSGHYPRMNSWDAPLLEEDAFLQVAFSADGKFLISTHYGGKIRFWDTMTFEEVRRFDVKETNKVEDRQPFYEWRKPRVTAIQRSADGRLLTALNVRQGFEGYQVNVWDADTGKVVRRRRCVADPDSRISPDGKLCVRRAAGEIIIEQTLTGKRARVLPGCAHSVWAFSNDSRVLAVLGLTPPPALARTTCPNCALLWDIATGRRVGSVPCDRPFFLLFSPDDRLLAFAREETATQAVIAFCELASGQEIFHIPVVLGSLGWGCEAGQVPNNSFAFSPDGRAFATGHRDTTILIWDLVPDATGGSGRAPQRKDLQELWSTLAGSDAPKAYAAGWALTNGGARAVAFLKARLHPASPPDTSHIPRLIGHLDSKQFALRDRASKELQAIGEAAEPALRKALEGKPSLELRRRAELLLKGLEGPVSDPKELRGLRAVAVLERVGSAEARRLLQALAGGAREARLTRDARAALARLAQRGGR